MKKILIIVTFIVASLATVQAQRFCVVDMEYILSNVKEYTAAQEQIETLADGWKNDISNKFKEIENAYTKFQAEQVLMTEQMKTKKIEEIEALEREAKNLQKAKFGPEGELFKKRQQLIKPIQDKVYQKVALYAKDKSYNVILDKSSAGISVLFVDERTDKSDEILRLIKE